MGVNKSLWPLFSDLLRNHKPSVVISVLIENTYVAHVNVVCRNVNSVRRPELRFNVTVVSFETAATISGSTSPRGQRRGRTLRGVKSNGVTGEWSRGYGHSLVTMRASDPVNSRRPVANRIRLYNHGNSRTRRSTCHNNRYSASVFNRSTGTRTRVVIRFFDGFLRSDEFTRAYL